MPVTVYSPKLGLLTLTVKIFLPLKVVVIVVVVVFVVTFVVVVLVLVVTIYGVLIVLFWVVMFSDVGVSVTTPGSINNCLRP